jgi:hypothetical protein
MLNNFSQKTALRTENTHQNLNPYIIFVAILQRKSLLSRQKRGWNNIFFSPVALRPEAGHGLHIVGVSRANTTHHSR